MDIKGTDVAFTGAEAVDSIARRCETPDVGGFAPAREFAIFRDAAGELPPSADLHKHLIGGFVDD